MRHWKLKLALVAIDLYFYYDSEIEQASLLGFDLHPLAFIASYSDQFIDASINLIEPQCTCFLIPTFYGYDQSVISSL